MRPQRRTTITGEVLGRWVIAIALVPVGLVLIAVSGGRVTAGLLITLIVVMVIVAMVRAACR